jgi:hypothetical protein
MGPVAPLSGNDYRKRVLAPIEARGGMDATDPFEVYDLPLESVDELTDAQVSAQLAQVWALWQKQRDHPKFRGLVTALLESHDDSCEQLATARGRREMAARAAAFREERDGERFAQLDAAVRRLVDRFGGLPRGKVEGLRALGLQSGIGVEDVEARIRRYRLIDDAPIAAVPVEDLSGVYRQVRGDLEELGQLDSEPPPASLYALIGLPPGAAPQRVRAQRDALAARNRERRPDRRRALIDDLLAAVTSLLVDGDAQAYLEALVADVAAMLRPRVAAAILIEDALTIADHEILLAAAQEAGLDHPRAVRVLGELAREHGVRAPEAMPPAGAPAAAPMTEPPSPAQSQSPAPVSAAAWQEELSRARAALRSGLLRSAQRHVQAARAHAGQTLPPIRALDDEVGRRIAEAQEAWRAIARSLSSSLLDEAAAVLESLVSGASEILSPDGESAAAVLDRVRGRLADITSALSAAMALPGEARELALLDLATSAAGHSAVVAALASIPPAPATSVTARRVSGGVVVAWHASRAVGEVAYRVARREADGTLKGLGGTPALSLETWAPDGPLPEFVVIARRAGIESPPASSSAPAPLPPAQGSTAPAGWGSPEPVASLEIVPYRARLRLIYPVPAIGRVEVLRLAGGVAAPPPGTAVPDPASLGVVVPSMTPGLALDARPAQPVTVYLAVTSIDGATSVAGASASFVAIPAMSGLSVSGDRLTWTWPSGCTEAVIVWRRDGPPAGPGDPDAQRRKLTITRREIDGGLLLPADRPLHLAIFGSARVDGQLVTDPTPHPGATLTLP